MLFWLFVIILALGFLLCWLGYEEFGVITNVLAAIAIVISLFIIISSHTSSDACIAQNQVKYESLCYKLKSESVRDDLGLLNKEIVDEIQAWNENVVYHQHIQDSFWLGIYYPNIYDQFETIPLE